MNPQHRMTLDSYNGEELLFVCPHEGCGRGWCSSDRVG